MKNNKDNFQNFQALYNKAGRSNRFVVNIIKIAAA
jgi:hypothetical protein